MRGRWLVTAACAALLLALALLLRSGGSGDPSAPAPAPGTDAGEPPVAAAPMVDAAPGRTLVEPAAGAPDPATAPDARRSAAAQDGLRVQVVDGRGAPRAGVPLALRRQSAWRGPFESTTAVTEGPDGIARFTDLGARLRRGPGWNVVFAFPLANEPALPIDASALGARPLRLLLPATGGLSIQVHHGPELRDPTTLELRLTAMAASGGPPLWPDGPWARPPIDGQGRAEVPWVGLGLQFAIELRRQNATADAVRTTVAGPRRDGEVVACELTWTAPALAAVTGRFVRRDGRPWPAATVRAQALLSPTPAEYPLPQQLAVDAGGRFRLELPFARAAGGSRRYMFTGPHPDGLGSVIAFVPLDDATDGLDLGDIVLDHGPLLAAGQVVDPRGQPVRGARFRLAEHTVALQQPVARPVFTAGDNLTGADGRFALYLPPGEPAPQGQLELTTECDGWIGDGPRQVATGDRALVLVLAPAGAIAGWLQLDDGLAPGDVTLALVGTPAGQPRLPVNVRGDGTFAHLQLPAGEFDLQVFRRGADGRPEDRPATTVEGLLIEPGRTNRDDRLQGLRVGSNLPLLRITVRDRNRVPIAGAKARLRGVRNARALPGGPDGVCRVHTATLPATVVVQAFGYRPRTLPDLVADAEAVLDDGIAVRLRLGVPAQGNAPNYRIGLLLYEVDAAGVVRGLVYDDLWPAGERFFDADGELAVRLPGPGPYQGSLIVAVTGADHVGRGGPINLPSPPRFLVADRSGEQVFTIDVPQTAVDEAVRQVNR